MVREYGTILIGTSAGGSAALTQVLPALPATYPLPVIVVQHLHPLQGAPALVHYQECCALKIKEAEEKEGIRAGFIYFAPPNYHLLVEDDCTFSLSIDARVNFTRPSIDVLFESAADAYGPRLVGIVMTGANNDGAQGLQAIRKRGGLAIVQDPATAEAPYMPQAALDHGAVDYVLPLVEIGEFLATLVAPHPLDAKTEMRHQRV